MAGLGHAQDTATPGGVYLQGQLVTDSGLAAHHVYIGEAGRLPGARTTHCYLRPRSEMDFSLPPRTSYYGRRRGGCVPGLRRPGTWAIHHPSNSIEAGCLDRRRSRRLSLREAS